MGQNICRCVKADRGDDCRSVYGELQSTPTGSTVNSRDCLPPPVGSTDGDGSARRDGVKKGRFWKWMKGRKKGDISERQVSVEVCVDQETHVSEPDGDGSGKRDEVKKKKKRFWKWKKGRKAHQSATEVAVVSSDNITKDEISVQQVNVGVLPSLDCSVSNSSEGSFHTPALSLADLLVNDRQSPVRSVSDSSEDNFYTPALSLADLLVGIPQSLVRPVSDPSVDSIQIPFQSGSNLSDVSQPSVSSRMLFEFDDQCVLDAKNVEVNFFQYKIGEMLGEGGYGAVYEGTRVKDGLKVAVKYVKKSVDTDYIRIPCHPEPLPREIALLILATTGTPVPEIIQLLDWEDKSDHYVMIQECPSPCLDLHSFVCSKGGKVREALAQIIIWQATIAASVCCERGVFHRDIKLNNLLINTDTLDVKLIDFGCGDLWKKSKYKIFQGTVEYCCPEFYEKFEYHAEPATVWSLGVTLFAMLCGFFPGFQTLDKIKQNRWSRSGLSKECCNLIQSCLQEDPNRRIRLKDILLHEWFEDFLVRY
ncbi:serine/threonine-protein kinase pim-2-like isoform X2 [Triplophysa dalaica]|uniref:serine/threonine-protein kinase pim-2-like isoform X2 n=1 Tax=Triplophysa dalaica TaxID=1582913 RepID=UPI0024E03298|nr:serine/threonine-protein kinase pim-2-like isoform X2 [Triplophysa dalaica]